MKEGLLIEVRRRASAPYDYHGATMYYLYYARIVCYHAGKRIWSEKAGLPTICRKYAEEAGSNLLKYLLEREALND
jgi:hypothetical protein